MTPPVDEYFVRKNASSTWTRLFWPNKTDFVRVAARFNAVVVPFGGIGADDSAQVGKTGAMPSGVRIDMWWVDTEGP